jgi:hypothetical protein
MMMFDSYLVGFMVTPAAKLLPLAIVFVAAFLLLKKLNVPHWQVWVYVAAFALGLILLPFSAMAWIKARETYGLGSTFWVSSLLSLLSMNIGPLVLLVIALKAKTNVFQVTGKEH